MDIQFRRGYVRTCNWQISAKASEDAESWFMVDVPDIAAGGLMFSTDRTYKVGDELWFELHIDPGVISIFGNVEDFDLRLKTVVKNVRGLEDKIHSYGVEYTEISNNDQIHLDELIKLTIAKYGLSDRIQD